MDIVYPHRYPDVWYRLDSGHHGGGLSDDGQVF